MKNNGRRVRVSLVELRGGFRAQIFQGAALNRGEMIEFRAYDFAVDPRQQSQHQVSNRAAAMRSGDSGERSHAAIQTEEVLGEEIARVQPAHAVSDDVDLAFRKTRLYLLGQPGRTILD